MSRWDEYSKRTKVTITCLVIVGIIFIIFLWIYYVTDKAYYKIYLNDEFGQQGIPELSATDIVYYGPDINSLSKDPEYSEYDRTNGIICMYALYSRWDKHRGVDNYLLIVGNVSKIIHIKTGTEVHGYGAGGYFERIDKYYYLNSDDYDW